MRRFHRTVGALVWAIAGVTAGAVNASETGVSDASVPYVSGGVGQAERTELLGNRNQYDLWVTTVARGSGAYLANAQVEIVDTALDRPVLTHKLAGPWLFASLPAGRYRVTATVNLDRGPKESRSRNITIRPGAMRQVVFRFNSDAQVSPERPVQFGGNPFSK